MMQGDTEGKRRKGEGKKFDTRVDFTPMVDMIMLLLTFFMLATTLSKPQTMEIAMPAKDTPKDKGDVAKESDAVTIYLGADNKIYYFLGIPEPETPNFLKETDFSATGLRKLLMDKNIRVVTQVNELKDQKTRLQISQEEYDQKVKELKGSPNTPVVVIKPLDNSNYDNLVSALDEMLIASVGKYAIADLDANDEKMLINSNVQFNVVD
ncbi:MAG: biopolymer transporter ExbD [Porphyromonadaceae bacterium]|nr:biopolymer transporter ExbD [Porphyromonadaceae bacterium]